MTGEQILHFAIRWVAENIGEGPYPFLEPEDPLLQRTLDQFIADAEQAGISLARLEAALCGARGYIEDAFDLVTDPATVPSS